MTFEEAKETILEYGFEHYRSEVHAEEFYFTYKDTGEKLYIFLPREKYNFDLFLELFDGENGNLISDVTIYSATNTGKELTTDITKRYDLLIEYLSD